VGGLGILYLGPTENGGAGGGEIIESDAFQQECVVFISGVFLSLPSFCLDLHLDLGPPVGVLGRIFSPPPPHNCVGPTQEVYGVVNCVGWGGHVISFVGIAIVTGK